MATRRYAYIVMAALTVCVSAHRFQPTPMSGLSWSDVVFTDDSLIRASIWVDL
jgi:hypothetical protein